MRGRRSLGPLLMVTAVLGCVACDGPQSVFMAQGTESARVLWLMWVMVLGAALIFTLVIGLTGLALFGPDRWRRHLSAHRLVSWGGIGFPVVVLSALLSYGFAYMVTGSHARDQAELVRISVVGEQWWWRVIYHHADGRKTESANQIHLPTGRTVELELTTADVIHSFWLPAYGGKVDMVPGRRNVLRLRVDQASIVRGQCAEFCGGAHALMAFYAVAMPPPEFSAWLQREQADAVASEAAADLFIASGCGACHQIRGTAARGRIGPDLTHLGSRHSLGAGTVSNDAASLAHWIRNHQQIKPANLMPRFDFLADSEVEALAAYLAELD
jgi:cytochrome c oxidase subunit 2